MARFYIAGYVNVLQARRVLITRGRGLADFPNVQVMEFVLSRTPRPRQVKRAGDAVDVGAFIRSHRAGARVPAGATWSKAIILPLEEQLLGAMAMAAMLRQAVATSAQVACQLRIDDAYIVNKKVFPVLDDLRLASPGFTFPETFDADLVET